MTEQSNPPEPPAGAPQTTPTPPPQTREKNVVGLVALILSVLGFVFACVPGALVVGWILLPVGFILGIVAVTRKDRKKATGVAAIVVSVVGTIVGVIVFVVIAAGAVSDGIDDATGGDTTVVAEDDGDDADAGDDTSGDEPTVGTRGNPYAFTDAVQNDDWTIELTGFNADANSEVAEANQFNDAAADGTQWITVTVAATYTGDAETGNAFDLSFGYVAADGTVVGAYDSPVAGLEPEFDGFAELYEGGTEEGKIAFLVPDSVDGLVRVTPGVLADDVFFALPSE